MQTWMKCPCLQVELHHMVWCTLRVLPWGPLLGRNAFAGESTALLGTNVAATKRPPSFDLRNNPGLVTTYTK